MNKYLNNTKVLTRTFLRVVVLGAPMLVALLGRLSEGFVKAMNDKLPGLEGWQK